MNRICVFCGSSVGADPRFLEAARALGRLLAARGTGLVFGGGSVGLMGALADAVLASGGQVTGVIPDALGAREIRHPGVKDMRVVPSMHARKALMAELADAFVALPGGFGTLDELFEIVTWAQLGIHAKPIGLLNVAGYYDPLLRLIEQAIASRFVPPEHRELIAVADEPQALLERLAGQRVPRVPKWLRPEQA